MKRILLLAFMLVSSVANANTPYIEEVKVYGTRTEVSDGNIRAGLTNVVLHHEYDETKESWRYVGYTDAYGKVVEVETMNIVETMIANILKRD